MLVVSRKKHEFIQIGEDIVIKVIKTSRGSVKIGIDAPGGTRVLRGELSIEELFEPAPKPLSRRPRQLAPKEQDSMQPVGAL
ncbi:carbon storage regulator [Thalassoglobus sp. JC818]|uniref:carbon storage regulator n=1 Tax=Thalassoglobus sp. JC818 TaxID=3232136 RepID=UPI003458226C